MDSSIKLPSSDVEMLFVKTNIFLFYPQLNAFLRLNMNYKFFQYFSLYSSIVWTSIVAKDQVLPKTDLASSCPIRIFLLQVY